MASPRWVGGHAALCEGPDSPKLSLTGERDSCTRIFSGTWADILAGIPTRGSTMTGMPAGYTTLKVLTVEAVKKPGGKGVMTVVLDAPKGGGGGSAAPAEYVYEVEWEKLEKPLAQAPIFITAGGPYELTLANLADLKNWDEEKNPTLRVAYKFRNEETGAITELTDAGARLYVEKRLNGVESFLSYYPVCRLKIYTTDPLPEGPCGYLEDPPDFPTDLVDSYAWLKTADRCSRTGRSGKWERQQEWTGADEWDTDLYPATPP